MSYNPKFKEFYYIVDNDTHPFTSLKDISDAEYEALYSSRIFCPVCKQAELTLVHGYNSTYLKTKNGSEHGYDEEGKRCYSIQLQSQNAHKTNNVKEITDPRKINSLLNSAIREHFKEHLPGTRSNKLSSSSNKSDVASTRDNKNDSIGQNSIYRCSFSTWGKDTPQDRLILVYGEVDVTIYSFKPNENKAIDYLRFYIPGTNSLITSCIKPYNLDISNGKYFVAALGLCQTKHIGSSTFYDLHLNRPLEKSIKMVSLSSSSTL